MGLFSRKDRDLSKVTLAGLVEANAIGPTKDLRRAILRKLAETPVWFAANGLPDGVEPAPGSAQVLDESTSVQLLTTTGPDGGRATLWFGSAEAAVARVPGCVPLALDFGVAAGVLGDDPSCAGVVVDTGTPGWAYYPRSEVLAFADEDQPA
jgi:hypothetical protein